MNHRLLATGALTFATSTLCGCQFFLVPSAPEAGVFAPETRYVHDKVFTTLVTPPGTVEIEARLSGPGASTETLDRIWTCDSVGPGDGATACSFPLPRADARAGTYTISVHRKATGEQVSESHFALVPVPGMGGAPSLIVDPTPRRGVAYVHDKRITTWLPIDASYFYRTVSFYVVVDGVPNLKALDSKLGSASLEGDGEPAVDLAPVTARLPELDYVSGETHALDVVAFVGQERVGGWTFQYGASQRIYSLSAITDDAIGDYAIVEPAAPNPVLDEKLASAQKKHLSKGGEPRWQRNFVSRVCAVLSDEKAKLVALDLEDRRRKGKHATETHDSISVAGFSVDTGSGAILEGFPRWLNGLVGLDRFNRLDLSSGPEEMAYRQKLWQLDQLAARYDKNCMTKVLAGVDWLLPPPDVDEVEELFEKH